MLFKNVKELCESNSITFAQLERELGFGNGTIRKWAVASPSVDRLEKVADFFKVTTDRLLGRNERKD